MKVWRESESSYFVLVTGTEAQNYQVHEQMSRSGGQSEARPQCLSPQAQAWYSFIDPLQTRPELAILLCNEWQKEGTRAPSPGRMDT
ncbi:hypothetical protein TNCV_498831 [Trichonephila clavipes]|nr:hypothetical protein TNCV_498831 [Trichonephila clavipes]